MVTPHFTVVINIVLAFIPLALASYLFLFKHHVFKNGGNILWWLLLMVCVAFLPNSAYTVTDIIHFIAAVKDPNYSALFVWLVLLPAYCVYFFITFQFYVLSVFMMQQYIGLHSNAKLAFWFIPFINLLCAIGVYLGRVQRLESYDILRHPSIVIKDLIADLTHFHPLLVIMGFALLFFVLYLIFNFVNQKVGVNRQIEKRMKAVN